jgi:hypothetical protein
VQPKTSAEEWQKRVERWRESGLSAVQYAAETGINAGTLKFWHYKLTKAKRSETGRVRASKKRAAFVEVRAVATDARFEVELRNGRQLRVPESFEEKALERLLAVLDPG